MALKVDFELDGVIHRDCYLRIHKIRTVHADYEYFKIVDDPERPDVHQELAWEVRMETHATAYVWADKLARENRAQPLKWFGFDFEYDLESPDNIYRQAYNSIKLADEFKDGVDV